MGQLWLMAETTTVVDRQGLACIHRLPMLIALEVKPIVMVVLTLSLQPFVQLPLPFEADFLTRFEELSTGLPVPAITDGVAHGQRPQPGVLAKQVAEVIAPAMVVGVGHGLAMFRFKILFILAEFTLTL